MLAVSIMLFVMVSGWFLYVGMGALFALLFINKAGRKVLATIVGLLVLLWLLLQTELVQNFIVGKVTERLSNDLHTEIKIDKVSFSFFDKMDLGGVLVRDRKKDTLLYAGSLKLRITDWFFLRDTVDLKYVGLENASIYMHRRDSVWNYQFIADHFASKDTTKKDSAAKAIALNIQKVDLKKVRFVKNDEWRGQKMTFRIGSMLLDASKTDLDNGIFNINSIDLDQPYFALENFDGFRPEPPADTSTAIDTGMYFNEGDIKVRVANINLSNGTFVSQVRGEVPDKNVFDGTAIKVNKINGTLKEVSFLKDTIKAKVNLDAVERSGFELKKLKANFKFTPQMMEFADLDIRTNTSRLGNYYAMHYKDFNEDMNDYIAKVRMDVHIKNAVVSSDDVAFFAPELSEWNKTAGINGKFHGTVDNFKVDDLFMRTGPNMYASGTLTMKGLPDIDKTIITVDNANVLTNNEEIAFLYPDIKTIKTPDFSTLGNILYRGNFKGTINDFTATGNISSKLGGVYSSVNMKFPKRGEPYYKGNIQTQQFDLGKFIDVSSLGQISFKGKIEGRSFDVTKAKTTLDGNFDSLQFNDYFYKDLSFSGNMSAKKFNGDFKANDPNFDFTSNIEIDLSGKKPVFNILGDLSQANFKKLNFTKEDFQLTGLFDLNFKGRNIDEFLGSAKILNASLLHENTKLDFDSLIVNAFYNEDSLKTLTVGSNQFDAMVYGQYNILDLPNSFQLFLNRYYPSFINKPKTTPKNQDFKVEITTKDFSGYAPILDRNLSGLDNINITGSVNTNRHDSGFYVNASIPYVKFKKYQLENANIVGTGTFDSLRIKGDVNTLYVGDSLYFPNSTLDILSTNDHSVVRINTSANETLNEASFNADVYTLEDGVRINFLPSSFVLNTKKWNIEEAGELVVRKHFASANNVKFSQGFQEIRVETEEDDGGNASNLVIRLKDVNMGDIIPLFTKDPRIEGLASGRVYLRDFYNKFHAEADLSAYQFRLNDDSIGIVHVDASYNNDDGKIKYDVVSNNAEHNFTGNGYYNLKDSVNSPMYNIIHLKNTRLFYVDQFLTSLFSDVDGYGTGDLVIKGDPQSPELLGRIKLVNAGLTVNYTRVHYTIDSADFAFNDGSIDFGKFSIKDKYKNSGTVRGVMYEKGFKNMRYDFDLATDKLLLLDTRAVDNTQFYGKAIGKATLSLKGPQENMRMTISGEPNDSTHIYIPTSTSRESADADFIVFKQYGTELENKKPESDVRLNIDLDLTANNKAQIDVILDELTGDVIQATGDGRIRINVPANGNMTMNGRYNIESGKYDFNFQAFLRKPFILRKGAGNFIEWNGDPYNANMKIDAQYTARNVTFNELLTNTGYNLGSTVRGYRGDVYVIANLTGRLSNPDIKFSFDFPQGSPIENNTDLKMFLDKVQSDDNEMLKQVTWLIIFGSFSPYGELGGGGTTARTAGINTISQKITAELNKVVSNLLTQITGDKSLHFDVSTSTYSSASLYGTTAQSNQLDRQSINLKLNQSLLNDNVIITFGTALDFNISSSAVQSGNFQWLPDISVEFVLSRDRKLRAIVFNRSSLDVNAGIIGRRIRQGISISYSLDFPREDDRPVLIDTSSTPAVNRSRKTQK